MSHNDMTSSPSGGSASAPGSASGALEGLAEAGRETLEDVKARAYGVASRTAEAAKHEAMARGEAAKDSLAGLVHTLASSLRDAAGQAGEGEGTIQGKLMAAAADSIEDMSESIRHRPLGDLMGEAEAFARRNPGAFVAAAALVGFGIARFARASSPQEPSRPGSAGGAGVGMTPAGGTGTAMRGGISTSGMSTHGEDDDSAGGTMAGGLSGQDRTMP
ncbi:hypothetical protein [Rubellimicrobium sp. CFH 75288]|uniref:hypothetical protein n=1 Tax=Rubellimicrobium sp. CFH 75288 TaxID=2697034 RepID=UPI0014135B93|nr:hypothetical protein [Rubellimicrobium sp. CFH 75288]NAZ38121.1 hypothetical protein [Rubellimicrobium sp. CFH 75288]